MGTHPIFESDFDCLTVEMGGLGDIVEKIVNISNFYSNKENRDLALNYVRNNDVTKLDEARIVEPCLTCESFRFIFASGMLGGYLYQMKYSEVAPYYTKPGFYLSEKLIAHKF